MVLTNINFCVRRNSTIYNNKLVNVTKTKRKIAKSEVMKPVPTHNYRHCTFENRVYALHIGLKPHFFSHTTNLTCSTFVAFSWWLVSIYSATEFLFSLKTYFMVNLFICLTPNTLFKLCKSHNIVSYISSQDRWI